MLGMTGMMTILLLAVASSSLSAQGTQVCPDDTDTPAILESAIDKSFAALRTGGAPPPTCLLTAIAKTPAAYSDSTINQALAVSDALVKANPEDAANLSARITLLSRARRYADVGPALDRLFAVEWVRLTLDHYKMAIAAAQRLSDTVQMDRHLAGALMRFPQATQLNTELAILRQVPRLTALLDTVKRVIKADPRKVDGYASLISIHGNLGQVDSALAYTRIALTRRVQRQTVATALESLLGVLLRRAQLHNAYDVWEATLPVALTIDSTFSTPTSMHLVALSLSAVVSERITLLTHLLTGTVIDQRTGMMRTMTPADIPPAVKALGCPKLAELTRQVAQAQERLDAGGNRFAPETVPAILGGLGQMRGRIAFLQARCNP
jgi:hypothetical protein